MCWRFPGAAYTYASAVSDDAIAGITIPAGNGGGRQGFIYKAGVLSPFGYPGAMETLPESMNNAGDIAGFYAPPGPLSLHGFVYQNGTFTTIDPPRSDLTSVYSINDKGVVAGYFYRPKTGRNTFGFTYDHGIYKVYQYPDPAAMVTSINYVVGDHQQLGEYYDLVQNHIFGVLHGVYYLITPPGSIGAYIYGANSAGSLVGGYFDSSGVPHAFVATCATDQAPCTQ